MLKTLVKVNTSNQLPDSTSVVIIGGGIVGICTALTLAERGVPVVVLEKGHIAAEQSSRNLGWIRKTSRHAEDVPLAQAADKIWSNLSERVDAPVGYRQAGIMFLGDTDEQMAIHEKWLDSVAGLDLDSTLLSKAELDKLVPGGNGSWKGAVYTPSDGRGEPTLATSAIANAAIKYGATIVQQCAVRTLSMQAGKVSGVITELGEIRCDQVLLAGGAWSRRFLGNLGVQLPTLPVIASVLRTKPIKGPTEIAVGGSDFSFRKHQDGGFIIMQRGKVDAPLTLDHLKIGLQFKDQLRFGKDALNISFGKEFFEDLSTPRSWTANKRSPFESIRVREPRINHGLLDDAMRNTINAWPIFKDAELEESWAGLIDVTPDSMPVIDRVQDIPGLTVATGFSGHGFGTGPAAGQLAADIVMNDSPLVDPAPYRFNRF
ncbi:MAG: FAD-binding oxidoreductase [Pseudomonadota bacterium]|nr:FAD-binding oxidoreductase [Pseudomonadota bacterium]